MQEVERGLANPTAVVTSRPSAGVSMGDLASFQKHE
jgi:hypothetical protein